MFVCDNIVYLQLQKTGCSHVAKLLGQLLKGEQIGSHNRLTTTLLNSDKFVLGSVRNPWDWYISLWGYGCDKKGALYRGLTSRRIRIRGHGFRINLISATKSLVQELKRPGRKYRKTYKDSNNPELFRRWLHLIHDAENKYLGDQYKSSPINQFAGFYTYRYLFLFSRDVDHLYTTTISNLEELNNYDEQNNVLDYTVRLECLEEDLVRALEACGTTLTDEQLSMLYSSKRTNASSRK
ncbi:MAG: hypothetical protein ACYST2_06635, partial [Planctomycetota bacterium]